MYNIKVGFLPFITGRPHFSAVGPDCRYPKSVYTDTTRF